VNCDGCRRCENSENSLVGNGGKACSREDAGVSGGTVTDGKRLDFLKPCCWEVQGND
jgi:hypothetical protein